MPTNPGVTRLKSELDSAYVTIERQRRSMAVYQGKIRKLEARLARFTKKNKSKKKRRAN
jgi:hypothetical protein